MRTIDAFNHFQFAHELSVESTGGYVATPLTGVWATAPYLHNGSVPTLAALLDSTTRPKYWSRKYGTNGSYDSNDYDEHAVG